MDAKSNGQLLEIVDSSLDEGLKSSTFQLMDSRELMTCVNSSCR
jgi:hypothetical protein